MSQAFAFKRRPGKQRGVTYVLLFWSMFALVCMMGFFTEGIAFFSTHPTSPMNDTEFFICFGVVLFCVATFTVLVHRNFKLGIHWGWLILFLGLFTANAAATFLFDSHITGTTTKLGETWTYDYTFTLMERIRYLCTFLCTSICLYMYFAVFPKIFHNTRRLHFFCYLCLGFVAVLIVYSLIAEWPLYATMFDPTKKWAVTEVRSLTNNPNTFGFCLLLAMFSVFILHNARSHWWWVVIMFLLGIWQLIIGSGSACLASWALIIAFVIYRFCVTLKYYTGRALFWMFLFVVAAITFAILIFAEVGGDTSFFARLGKVLKSAQFSDTAGRLRIDTWQRIIDSLNTPLKWVLGVGEPQCYYFLGLLENPSDAGISIYYAHSGFMHQLLAGGLLRLGLYLLLLARFVYLCVKGAKRHSRVAWPVFICMGALLLRSCFETTAFLGSDTKAITVYLLLVLPIEVDEFLATHPEVKGYEEEARPDANKLYYRYDMTPMRMAKIAFFFMTPISALMLGASTQFSYNGYLGNWITWSFYAMWALGFLCVPFGFYCIGHHADKADRRIYGGLLGFGYAAALIAGSLCGKYAPIVTIICMAVIPVLTLITYLLHARSVHHFRQKLFLHAYLPHLIICGVLVGLTNLGFLIPDAQKSLFNPIMMSAAIIVIYLGVVYSLPGQELAFPVYISLQRFDCRRTAIGIPKQAAMEYKQTYYLCRGHMDPTEPGKTFIHRY